MNTTSLVKKFKNQGYCNGSVLFEEEKVENLRQVFEQSFSKKNFPESISLFDIEDQQAIKIVVEAFNSEKIQSILQEISKYSKTKISVVPVFNIQRNYHIDRLNSPGIGWHRDCGGEFEYDYCRKKLYDKSYIFGKIGIYLQENSAYGGSIDLIPYSHRYFSPKTIFIRKLKGIPLKFISKIQTRFPRIYKLLPEKFFMYNIGAKRMFPKIGSPVLFDSRITHRGSPIDDTVRKEINFFPEKVSADTPKNKIKYSIYAQFGSTLAVDSYMFDRLKRKGHESELRRWCFEQQKVEELFPNLGLLMKNVIDPILPKYNQHL